MRRTLAAAAAVVAVGVAVAPTAVATVKPTCTTVGLDLEWTNFANPGPHVVEWSIDGHVQTTWSTVTNGTVTHVALPGAAPREVVTFRERWGAHAREALTMLVTVRCVPVPPPPPDTVPPTAPEPPTTTPTTTTPPVTPPPPPAPRPRPNCQSRPKPGPRWCPPARPKPPIRCNVVPRPGPRWCPPLRIPPAVPVPNPAG